MKKIVNWLLGGLVVIISFLAGVLVRQPKINKLRKQVELLQKDNRKLIDMITDKQQNYQELVIQLKALKAMQFRKKSILKDQMTENLVMQYAIKAYLMLLLKSGRYDKPLEKDEIMFFTAFEKVIDGKKLTTSDKLKIREYITEHHSGEIKQFKECEYASVLEELQNHPIKTK